MRLFPKNMYGILFLGQKAFIWDIKFKIYGVSKFIPAAKSQNFVDISGAQKPTWSKFLEFEFFHLKRPGYIDITRTKSACAWHHSAKKNIGEEWNLMKPPEIFVVMAIFLK